MIELLTNANGQTVIRRDGRLLASQVDPVAEAKAWLSRRMRFMDKVKTVFVLGMGAGYHIQVLCETTSAKIVVIEPDLEVIEAAAKIHSFPADRVLIETVQSPRGLRSAQSVRDGVRASFVVLLHPASRACDPAFYKDCQAQLTGRDWGSLNWQWKLKNGPSLDSSPRVATEEALTIYDLEQTELVQNSEERERMLIKALRELVK